MTRHTSGMATDSVVHLEFRSHVDMLGFVHAVGEEYGAAGRFR